MTSKGMVSVQWQLVDSKFRMHATWPEQIACTIVLPNGQVVRGEENGEFSIVMDWRNPSDSEMKESL
jgi:hypothetical protein